MVKHGKTKHLPSNIFKPFCVWWEKYETSSFLQSQLSWKACHGNQWSTTVHHLQTPSLDPRKIIDQWHDPVGGVILTNGMTSRSLYQDVLVPNMSNKINVVELWTTCNLIVPLKWLGDLNSVPTDANISILSISMHVWLCVYIYIHLRALMICLDPTERTTYFVVQLVCSMAT